MGEIHISDTNMDDEFYVVASVEQDGLVLQLVVPQIWAQPVKDGTIPSMMCHPQVLVTKA